MFRIIILIAALSAFAEAGAEEQNAQSAIHIGGPNSASQDDIDQEITHPRLRAESGSKSKLSLSTSLSYTGGALSRPFGSERPNLARTPGVQTTSSLDGGLNARFRWNKRNSVTLGTSFGLMTPFQGDTDSSSDQLNVYNPATGYSRVARFGNFQTTMGVAGDIGTSNESSQVSYRAGLGVNASIVYALSRLSVGLALNPYHNFYYNKPGEVTEAGTHLRPSFYGGDTRTGWGLNVFPSLEYAFSDRYSARTVFGYFNWRHLYGDSEKFRLLQTHVYQSVGLGISVTRDIYFYPNVQFVPDEIRSDFTNVALHATLNMF